MIDAAASGAGGNDHASVSYKESNPALMDTISGNVDFMRDLMMTSLQYVKGRQLKALAITS